MCIWAHISLIKTALKNTFLVEKMFFFTRYLKSKNPVISLRGAGIGVWREEIALTSIVLAIPNLNLKLPLPLSRLLEKEPVVVLFASRGRF